MFEHEIEVFSSAFSEDDGFLQTLDVNQCCDVFIGIFAPVSKIAKAGSPSPRSASAGLSKRNSHTGGVVDVSHVTAKVDSGMYSALAVAFCVPYHYVVVVSTVQYPKLTQCIWPLRITCSLINIQT